MVTRGTRSQKVSRFARFSLVATVLLVASFADHLQSRSFAPGQSAQSAISVKTELVRLPVSVTDASGNDNPVSVGLVVDHSRSMGAKLLAVAAAVAVFAHSSNPQDEMFVVDFNDDVTVELMDGKAFTSMQANFRRPYVRSRHADVLHSMTRSRRVWSICNLPTGKRKR